MSLFDLSFAVAAFATHDVTVTRYSAPGYDSHGRAIARTTTTVTARGSVQPVSGRDLQRLPEGVSSSDVRSVFLTANVTTGDEVLIGSERLQVVHVDSWSAMGNYAKVLARLLDAREGA